MSAEDHERRVREFVHRVWNERDYDAGSVLYDKSFTNPAVPGVTGPPAKVGFIRGYHHAFPDLTMSIDELVATETTVAMRYTATATDLGGFRGRPPTGLPVSMWAVSFLGFRGSHVVTEWIGADYLGMFEQLGVVSVWDQPTPTVTSDETS